MDPFTLAAGAVNIGGMIASIFGTKEQQRVIKKSVKSLKESVKEQESLANILRTEELRTRTGITDEVAGRMLAAQEMGTKGLQEAGARAVLGGATAQAQATLGNMLGLRQNLIDQEQARQQAVVQDKQRRDQTLGAIAEQKAIGAREAQAEAAAAKAGMIQSAVGAGSQIVGAALKNIPLYQKGRQGRLAEKAMDKFNNLEDPTQREGILTDLQSRGLYSPTAEGGFNQASFLDALSKTGSKKLKEFLDAGEGDALTGLITGYGAKGVNTSDLFGETSDAEEGGKGDFGEFLNELYKQFQETKTVGGS